MSFTFLRDPDAAQLGGTPEEFLAQFNGPVCLFQTGYDSKRCRALVTLLHGNEPSGLIALHRWLLSGQQPLTNIVCIIASVHAALRPPLFSHRQEPGERDLNRCFRPPHNDKPGKLAAEILEIIHVHKPEALIDIHNTSGSGPAFAVASFRDRHHEALAALFASQMIITHIKLGALMEISDMEVPTVTIEVGGRADEQAHELAYRGLASYFTAEQVLSQSQAQDHGVETLVNPVRVELTAGTEICYASQSRKDFDITLRNDIEQFNQAPVPADTLLGWARSAHTAPLTALDAQGRCTVDYYLRIADGEIRTARALSVFMITRSIEIAKSDCLFYAVANSQTQS